MKKYIQIILVLLLISACSGSDDSSAGPVSGPPDPTPTPDSSPTSARLVFPDNNLECNQGTNITETESTVEFRWEASSNTDTYEVEVVDLITRIALNVTTSETKTNITIKRATPYSWTVTSKSSVGESISDTWKFYNSGDGVTSYAPFPATIISPEVGAEVTANNDATVMVTWNGADVDDDLVQYRVFVGTEIDDIRSFVTVDIDQGNSVNLPVRAGVINYWKVVSIDSKGNTSESSLASFYVN